MWRLPLGATKSVAADMKDFTKDFILSLALQIFYFSIKLYFRTPKVNWGVCPGGGIGRRAGLKHQ